MNSVGDQISDCERNKLCFGEIFTDSLVIVNFSRGELCSIGKVNTIVFGYFLLGGECMYHFSCSPAGSVPVSDGQSNCKAWTLLICPCSWNYEYLSFM